MKSIGKLLTMALVALMWSPMQAAYKPSTPPPGLGQYDRPNRPVPPAPKPKESEAHTPIDRGPTIPLDVAHAKKQETPQDIAQRAQDLERLKRMQRIEKTLGLETELRPQAEAGAEGGKGVYKAEWTSSGSSGVKDRLAKEDRDALKKEYDELKKIDEQRRAEIRAKAAEPVAKDEAVVAFEQAPARMTPSEAAAAQRLARKQPSKDSIQQDQSKIEKLKDKFFAKTESAKDTIKEATTNFKNKIFGFFGRGKKASEEPLSDTQPVTPNFPPPPPEFLTPAVKKQEAESTGIMPSDKENRPTKDSSSPRYGAVKMTPEQVEQARKEFGQEATPVQSSIPLPPPLPPLAPPLVERIPPAPPAAPVAKKEEPASGKADLLEQIRQGAQLKKVDQETIQKPKATDAQDNVTDAMRIKIEEQQKIIAAKQKAMEEEARKNTNTPESSDADWA